MYNNCIITGADSSYYESLLTLISSIHKDSLELIDKIFVYNFGLTETEIKNLEKLKKINVINITENFKIFDTLSSIKTKCYFLKIYALYNSINLTKNVLWLDSGVCALKSLEPIFEIIDNEDIFLVGDEHLNKNYTHKKCAEIMCATEKELSDKQLSAGILGYKTNGKYLQLILDAWMYAQMEGCIDGYENNHRHDQSILSILSSRYNCKTNDIDIYGYWTDINRNLETAKKNGAIIFVHRKGYFDKTNLIYEN